MAELLGGSALASQTVVLLNPSDEEVSALRAAAAAAKAAKAAKKKAKGAADAHGLVPAKRADADGAQRVTGADGTQRVTGATDRAKEDACAAAKRYKAGDHAPAGATAAVWASLFTSSAVEQRAETFAARALSFRR